MHSAEESLKRGDKEMNSLKDYGDLFERLDLTELSVEEGDFKLKLKRQDTVKGVLAPENKNFETSSSKDISASGTVSMEDGKKSPKKDGVPVKAPLLGVFYGKVGEREALKAGDSVKKGDVLCTIEAMKMMNEVLSPKDGVIQEVLVSEGELIEFGQILFIID